MKKIFAYLMMAAAFLAIGSCSKDDEPSDYENTYDGVSVYLNAIEKLYDNNAEPAYTPSGQAGIYVASASSYGVSYSFISNLLDNPSWDGKDVTVKLGEKGESGSLKIIGETDALLKQGIYNKIIVDIKDYEPYTLEIITEQQADNGYYGGGVVKKLDEPDNPDASH